jgi:hypothetical protein
LINASIHSSLSVKSSILDEFLRIKQFKKCKKRGVIIGCNIGCTIVETKKPEATTVEFITINFSGLLTAKSV